MNNYSRKPRSMAVDAFDHDDVIKWKLFLCVTGGLPSQRPVKRSFDAFFDLCLNKQASKQSKRWWFETPPCSFGHHYNDWLFFLCVCDGSSDVMVFPPQDKRNFNYFGFLGSGNDMTCKRVLMFHKAVQHIKVEVAVLPMLSSHCVTTPW